jgi:hypothetical protein
MPEAAIVQNAIDKTMMSPLPFLFPCQRVGFEVEFISLFLFRRIDCEVEMG